MEWHRRHNYLLLAISLPLRAVLAAQRPPRVIPPEGGGGEEVEARSSASRSAYTGANPNLTPKAALATASELGLRSPRSGASERSPMPMATSPRANSSVLVTGPRMSRMPSSMASRSATLTAEDLYVREEPPGRAPQPTPNR